MILPRPANWRDDCSGLSPRDKTILELTQKGIGSHQATFVEVVSVLERTVAAVIPTGRVYILGYCNRYPIIGSLISGVALANTEEGVMVVRVRDGMIHQRFGLLVVRGP